MVKYKSYRKPYRIRRKKSILKSRFFWSSILFLIILGGAFYFFIFSNFLQIKKIIVTGEQKVSTEDIRSVVESELERKILFFETKSIFLVDLNKIRENLLKKFPRIGEAEIKRGLPDVLNLVIVERKEIGIFCRESICFLLGREGIIFDPVRNDISNGATESPLLRFQNRTFSEELKLGEKVIEKELLTSILQIESKLREDLKIPIKEILIASEENIDIKTNDGWEIYFNPKGNLNWQMAELTAILENRILPEKRKNLKHIDLRFEKVYIFPETYNQ